MEDGAKILQSKDLQDSFHSDKSGQVAHTPFYQEIKHCLEFLTQSVVKLRCHLASMPLAGTERLDSSDDVSGMPFEMDEEGESSKRWTEMSDEVLFKTYKNLFVFFSVICDHLRDIYNASLLNGC